MKSIKINDKVSSLKTTIILIIFNFAVPAFAETYNENLNVVYFVPEQEVRKLPFKPPLLLSELLSTPATYSDQVVSTLGYIHLDQEEGLLFESAEDYKNGRFDKSFSLDLGLKDLECPKNLNDNYCSITGTLNSERKGVRGTRGTVEKILVISRVYFDAVIGD